MHICSFIEAPQLRRGARLIGSVCQASSDTMQRSPGSATDFSAVDWVLELICMRVEICGCLGCFAPSRVALKKAEFRGLTPVWRGAVSSEQGPSRWAPTQRLFLLSQLHNEAEEFGAVALRVRVSTARTCWSFKAVSPLLESLMLLRSHEVTKQRQRRPRQRVAWHGGGGGGSACSPAEPTARPLIVAP